MPDDVDFEFCEETGTGEVRIKGESIARVMSLGDARVAFQFPQQEAFIVPSVVVMNLCNIFTRAVFHATRNLPSDVG